MGHVLFACGSVTRANCVERATTSAVPLTVTKADISLTTMAAPDVAWPLRMKRSMYDADPE